MVTRKTAKRDTDNIRKGETYLSITGRDADFVKAAAKKAGLSGEELVSKALILFIEKHGVRGAVIENGDAPL